jgi:UDP-N-acetylmuramate dehydrogenase
MNTPNFSMSSGQVQEHVPLAPHTYMKVGGPARFFALVSSIEDLIHLVKQAHDESIPLLILGGASNVLISDHGFDGLVIKNLCNQIILNYKDHTVTAESGTLMNQLVNVTLQHNLAGLEEFLGIPGTVGGAIYNNSHHLKHLIGTYVNSVRVISRSGKINTLLHNDMAFAYDASILQTTKDIVLSATFQLKLGDPSIIKDRAQKALQRRRDTQPLEFPSSGCMFKNIGDSNAQKYQTPKLATSAGFLIDQAGLKGTKIGGAQVSPVHANFIVNTGNATAQDVKDVSDLVIQKIKSTYGVTLNREVFLIGDFT